MTALVVGEHALRYWRIGLLIDGLGTKVVIGFLPQYDDFWFNTSCVTTVRSKLDKKTSTSSNVACCNLCSLNSTLNRVCLSIFNIFWSRLMDTPCSTLQFLSRSPIEEHSVATGL